MESVERDRARQELRGGVRDLDLSAVRARNMMCRPRRRLHACDHFPRRDNEFKSNTFCGNATDSQIRPLGRTNPSTVLLTLTFSAHWKAMLDPLT